MGLDTEYGIYVEGANVTDLVDEARALVASFPGQWAGPWDYSQEYPLRDLRGFQVNKLNTDPDDDLLERAPSKPLSRSEERSDRALINGARLYQDHGHPEYATPECRSLFDLVAQDKAGERIIQQCADAYHTATGKEVSLYKNNVDFHGMSYGTHENYLIQRDIPFEKIQAVMLPFLVSRILYTGAGKVTVEGTFKKSINYQLSQRADFFTEICSVDTLHRRPILNTRDEPHMEENHFRRLHVISGDANLCEMSIALKVGTASLALDLLEAGWQPDVTLKNPINAIKALSKDMAASLELTDGKTISGIELQRIYLNAAQSQLAGTDDETDWVLTQWESVLNDLEADPTRLRDRLDWVAKYELLTEFLEAEGLSWTKVDPEWLQSLDLAYHDVHLENGLYMGLAQAGEVQSIVSEADIQRALEQGPENTRAFARGYCAKHFKDKIVGITWSRIVFEHEGQQVILPLHDVYDEPTSHEINELVQQPEALLDALVKKTESA
jgi:proteasome accessory factor A